jgi:hypothetical protein
LILNEARQWPELAVLVMQVGYTNDLTYYYLGRAAEGLGFGDAAKTHYEISVRLTSVGITCAADGANYCNGQIFPAAAEVELAQLTAPPPAPPEQAAKTRSAQHQHRPPAKPASPPASASARTTAPATSGAASESQVASPDFAAPPPIRH